MTKTEADNLELRDAALRLARAQQYLEAASRTDDELSRRTLLENAEAEMGDVNGVINDDLDGAEARISEREESRS